MSKQYEVIVRAMGSTQTLQMSQAELDRLERKGRVQIVSITEPVWHDKVWERLKAKYA